VAPPANEDLMTRFSKKPSLFLAAAFLAGLLATATTVKAEDTDKKPLKNGDELYLKLDSKKESRFLSWYPGNWVVADSTTEPHDKGTWTVTNLRSTPGGGSKFNLVNKKSGTAMDGDNDNSVVLDDTDHTRWQIDGEVFTWSDLKPKQTALSYRITNSDWGAKFSLTDKNNEVHDIVLRKTNASYFYLIRKKK